MAQPSYVTLGERLSNGVDACRLEEVLRSADIPVLAIRKPAPITTPAEAVS